MKTDAAVVAMVATEAVVAVVVVVDSSAWTGWTVVMRRARAIPLSRQAAWGGGAGHPIISRG